MNTNTALENEHGCSFDSDVHRTQVTAGRDRVAFAKEAGAMLLDVTWRLRAETDRARPTLAAADRSQSCGSGRPSAASAPQAGAAGEWTAAERCASTGRVHAAAAASRWRPAAFPFRWLDTLLRARQRRRELREFATLDDRMLKDIGVKWADIQAALAEPALLTARRR